MTGAILQGSGKQSERQLGSQLGPPGEGPCQVKALGPHSWELQPEPPKCSLLPPLGSLAGLEIQQIQGWCSAAQNRSEAQYSEDHPYLQAMRVTEGFLAEKEQNGCWQIGGNETGHTVVCVDVSGRAVSSGKSELGWRPRECGRKARFQRRGKRPGLQKIGEGTGSKEGSHQMALKCQA